MNVVQRDLCEAVTHGLLEKVKDSINQYGIYNIGVHGYYLLLRKSIKLKHTQITKLLLTSASEEDTKRKTIASNTPLHLAVQDNDLEIIEMLLDHGANIHARNECGASPLLSAICMGESSIVELLIKKGTNTKTYNDGYSPLHVAAEQALNNISKSLLSLHSKRGERPQSDIDMDIPSIQYARPGNTKDNILELPDVTNNMTTILYLAIRNCHSAPYLFYREYRGVRKLEPGEVEFNCVVCKGLSMIFEDILNQCSENTKKIASESNSNQTDFITIVENLLKYDVVYRLSYDINHKVVRLDELRINLVKMIQHCIGNLGLDLGGKEQIVLHFVTNTKHKEFEIVKLLFVLKPVVISETGQTEPPEVFYSTENPDTNIAKVIVLLNTSVEVYWPLIYFHSSRIISTNNSVELFYVYDTEIKCDVKDSTLLHIASYQGNAEIIEILLENGVNVNSKRGNGDTALHIAVERCNIDVVKILLENGADVYSKNENGDTPLHVATKGTDLEKVSILLQYGSPVDSRNQRESTALDIAIYLAKHEFVRLLLEFGSDISNCIISYPERPCTVIRRGCLVSYVEKDLSEEEKAREEEEKKVFRILSLHLMMLKTANLFVDKHQQWHMPSHEYNDFILPHKQKCENEIKALKLEIISGNNLSLYDIMTKSMESLARYARNENVKKIFESDNYKTEFPIYATLLEKNFKMALLYERAQEFFYLNFNLPYDCSDQIFQYLKAIDLECFMIAMRLYEPKLNFK